VASRPGRPRSLGGRRDQPATKVLPIPHVIFLLSAKGEDRQGGGHMRGFGIRGFGIRGFGIR
jgi:hypothetical protein